MKINKIDFGHTTKILGTAFLCAVLAVAVVWPTPSRAQSSYTVAELQSLLTQILNQLSTLQNNSPSGVCPYVWTRSLGQGSTGLDVMRLQKFLNANADTRLAISGAGAPGMETQYYGPITASAVSKFQVKYRSQILTPLGLVNPTGYFGPSSTAQANRLCTTVPNEPNDNNNEGALKGGAGSLTDVGLMANISNEDVGEGQNDVEVLGLEVQAEGSDVELTALTLDLDQVAHSGNWNRYADQVTIWLDGEEYASIDADEFTRSNNYSRTITLDRGAILREGDTGELVVAVSAVNNLDSAREDDQWKATIDSVRFRDAMGASITDTQTRSFSRTMTFKEFADSVGLGVKIRGGDSSVNQAHVIEVSSTDKTTNVPVLSFDVEVEGKSDVMIDDLTVSATTTGATLEKVVSGAYLYLDGSRVGSKSISVASSSITFNDLNLNLDANDTHRFEVRFDLLAANGSNYTGGATVDVDVTTSNRDGWYIEDENGDSVALTDRSGSATADAHTLQTSGANITNVSSNSKEVYNSNTPSSSYGEYRMVVDVTAIGETIYVAETAARSAVASTTAGLTYYYEDNTGNEYSAGSGTQSFTRISGGNTQNGFVRIDEGQTARFELVTTLDPDAFGQYRVQIVSVGWNDTASTPDSTTTASPAINYRSGLQIISN